jgi:sulfate permease, SulP family
MHEIGEDNVFRSKAEAVARVFERLDRTVCATCTRRIFLECRSLPAPLPEVGPAASTQR